MVTGIGIITNPESGLKKGDMIILILQGWNQCLERFHHLLKVAQFVSGRAVIKFRGTF